MQELSSRLFVEQAGSDATRHDHPAAADALNTEGLRLAEAGDLPQAIKSFREATASSPGFAAAWQNLGVALAQSGDADAAAESFKTALALRPEYVEAHLN